MLYTSFTYTEDINKDEILGSVVVMKLTVRQENKVSIQTINYLGPLFFSIPILESR